MKIFSRTVLIATIFIFPLFAFATPNAVVKVKKNSNGVMLRLDSGSLRIQICTDKIVRVIYATNNSPAPNLDFVVRADWPKVKFSVAEQPDTVQLRTKFLSICVDKVTGALTFLDKAGTVLLAEQPDARKLQPNGEFSIAEDSFISSPDEFLYGLGQYQEGLWNWRGLPREFRQHNMTASLPMLVSIRGYGLLWNNESITDFNPFENEIPLVSANDAIQYTNSKMPKSSTWHGTFKSAEAGEYVFFARADNNRDEFSIAVDGKEIVGIKNYWTPFTLCGLADLPANKACDVTVRGGKNVKLFVGRRSNTTTFRSQLAKSVDFVFFYGPELDDVVHGYRQATGDAPMWPKWAFGFWQCRERYSSQQQLIDAAAEFRRRGIPLDLIVQDWKYWDTNGWGSYEWDKKFYSDPPEMIHKLHEENIKFMISVWCNPHGKTLADLTNHNATVGEWIDVFNPRGRDIRWKHLDEAFFKIGTDAWWGDATEPGDTGHSFEGRQTFLGPSDFYRNAYPLFASQSIYEGQRAADSSKRVCILTRSASPGLQRYASAIWSGDIAGNWQTLQRQIPAGLNFCIAGIPFWTTDCGGFWHPPGQYTSADYNELLARWFEWSTFCPILRIHGGATETEMWKWLPQTQNILRTYDELRYRLLPYNYSVAWRVTSVGDTMMRALAMDFRSDTNALAVSNEYMFGPAFLVAPVTEPQATTRKVYLPARTDWFDFWTGKKFSGGQIIDANAPLETMPLFVRAGSIVPYGPRIEYAMEKVDPIELRVYRGANGSFTLYEDEGDNYNYEKGKYSTIPISWDEATSTLEIGKRVGKFSVMLKEHTFHIVWISENSADNAKIDVRYFGYAIKARLGAPPKPYLISGDKR